MKAWMPKKGENGKNIALLVELDVETREECLAKFCVPATICEACGYIFPMWIVDGGIHFDTTRNGMLEAVCAGCGKLAEMAVVTPRQPQSLGRIQQVVRDINDAHQCAFGIKDPPRRAYCECSDCARWRAEMQELEQAGDRWRTQRESTELPAGFPNELVPYIDQARHAPTRLDHQVPIFADTQDGKGRYCVTVASCKCAWCEGVRNSEWGGFKKWIPWVERLGDAARTAELDVRSNLTAVKLYINGRLGQIKGNHKSIDELSADERLESKVLIDILKHIEA